MGKTWDVFKKIGDIKVTFHTSMSMIKDRNSKALEETEEIKKMWKEYTELYRIVLNDLDKTQQWGHSLRIGYAGVWGQIGLKKYYYKWS